MTILAAVKNPTTKEITLLSDSLATDTVTKHFTWCKWVEFKNFYVWISGSMHALLVLQEYLTEDLNKIKIKSKKDVIEIFKYIEATMAVELNAKRCVTDDRDTMDTDILVITKNWRMFKCSQYIDVDEYDDIAIIWSWFYYMQAALDTLQKLELLTIDNLIEAMETVYKYKANCGWPTYLINFNYK